MYIENYEIDTAKTLQRIVPTCCFKKNNNIDTAKTLQRIVPTCRFIKKTLNRHSKNVATNCTYMQLHINSHEIDTAETLQRIAPTCCFIKKQ